MKGKVKQTFGKITRMHCKIPNPNLIDINSSHIFSTNSIIKTIGILKNTINNLIINLSSNKCTKPKLIILNSIIKSRDVVVAVLKL